MTRNLARGLAAAATAVLLATSAGSALAMPGNDDIASPIAIPAIPYSNTQDTSDATTGATDPDCSGTGPTVWYAYTATEAGSLLAATFGSDYDTTLYVGTPDGSGGMNLIDCNDDAGNGLQSAIRFEAEAGTTYLFMIGAFAGGSGGSLVFSLDIAPPPLEMAITIDPRATFDAYGAMTFSGTVTCSAQTFDVGIGSQARQRVGRFIIAGYGETWLAGCGPDPSPFTIEIRSEDGRFAGGPATVYAFAYACDGISCADAFAEATVRLRR